MNTDYLIIGAGLSGSVIARELAERGKRVTVWDRRSHIGGNMYDYVNEHGILVQQYGPHAFHTTKKALYDYMGKYADWLDYKLTCGAEMDKITSPTPFNFKTIDDFYKADEAEELKKLILEAFPDRTTVTVTEVLNHSNHKIRGYGELLFEKDYSPYTAKQWGIPPEQVDPSILARVPLRFSYDEGYFDDEYQIMPKDSFHRFFQNLLNHENITVELEKEALDLLSIKNNKILLDGDLLEIPVVYTGPLDELFQLSEGALPYRSLRFEWKYEEIEKKQAYPVMAYPQEEGYTRITEYKKLPVQNVKGTSYALEYPLQYDPTQKQEPYYPLLTKESQKQYEKYKNLAEKIENLYCCGRLADFKYYNMDQALERAMELGKEIISSIV